MANTILLNLILLTLPADKLSLEFFSFTIRFNSILVFSLALLVLLSSKLLSFGRHYLYFIAFLLIASLLSFLFYPSSPKNLLYIIQGFLSLAAYPFVIKYFCTYFSVKFVVSSYIKASLAISLYAILQVFLSFFRVYDIFSDQILPNGVVRAAAFTYEPSALAIYLTFPSIFLIHLIYMQKTSGVQTPLKSYLTTFIILSAFVLTTSSTAITVIFAYSFYLIIFKFSKILIFVRKHLAFFFASFLTASIFFSYILSILPDSISKIWSIFDPMSHHSTAERFDMSANAIYAFNKSPIFGYGFGGVADFLYNRYISGDPNIILAPSRLLNGQQIIRDTFQPMTVSTEILSSIGVFGTIAILIYLFLLFKKSFRSSAYLQILSNQDYLFLESLAISCIFLLVALQTGQGLFRLYIIVPLSILASANSFLLNKVTINSVDS